MVVRSVRYWPWVKPKTARSSGGTSKVTIERLGGVGLDAAHAQVDGTAAWTSAQIGLKCSKGSRQARQRYSALQAVEPKADRRSVCALPQRGQATASARRPTMRIGALPSAARPRRRDAVVAQLAPAVVADPVGGPGRGAAHASRAPGPRPAASMASTHAALDDLGGRAAAVGRREHDLQRRRRGPAPRARCPGRAPRCAGTSGSGTASSTAQARSVRVGCERAPFTTRPRGRRAAGTASRPGCSPCARCARRACRCCGRPSRRGSGQRAPRRGPRAISASQGSRSSAAAGPRPLAAAAASTASASNSSARVGPQPRQRGLACGGATPRCRRPGAPPSRRHAAGGSALPSAPCRRWRPARRRSNRAAAAHSSFSQVASMRLRSTVKAKSPRGSSAARQRRVAGSRARRAGRRAGPRRSPGRALRRRRSVSSARAWPIRSSAMLVSAMSSSRIGRVAAPFAQALAEDQAGVAEAQQVLQRRRRSASRIEACIGAPHMWSTASGSL